MELIHLSWFPLTGPQLMCGQLEGAGCCLMVVCAAMPPTLLTLSAVGVYFWTSLVRSSLLSTVSVLIDLVAKLP